MSKNYVKEIWQNIRRDACEILKRLRIIREKKEKDDKKDININQKKHSIAVLVSK